jgi:hypothetical protein
MATVIDSSESASTEVHESESPPIRDSKAKKAKKNGAKPQDPYSIGIRGPPKQSLIAKLGYATHPSQGGTASHDASSRAVTRVDLLKLGQLAARSGRTHVILNPGPYELAFTKKKGVAATLFRHALRGDDYVKGLQVYTPKKSKDGYVGTMNDCPMQDLEEYHRAIGSPPRTLIYIGELSLGGQLGVDVWDGKATAFWTKREDGTVDTWMPNCVAQYPDRIRHPKLRTHKSGHLGGNLYFTNKPDRQPSGGRFITAVQLTTEFQPEVLLHKPISSIGVLVDDDGFVPALLNHEAIQGYDATPGGLAALMRHTYRIMDDSFGCKRLVATIQTVPGAALILNSAIRRTVSHNRAQIQCSLVIPHSPFEADVQASATKSFKELGPLAGVYESATTKRPLSKTIYKAFVAVKSALGAAYGRLRDILLDILARVKNWFNREEAPAGPANLVYHVSNFVSYIAGKAAPDVADEVSGIRKLGNQVLALIGRITNLLTKQFVIGEDDSLLSLVSKLFTILGTTLLERLVSSSQIGALIVSVAECMAFVGRHGFDNNSNTENVLLGLSVFTKALVHLGLFLLPLAVSIPLHLFVDMILTSGASIAIEIVNRIGMVGYIKATAERIRARGERAMQRAHHFFTEDLGIYQDSQQEMQPMVNQSPSPWNLEDDAPLTGITVDGERAPTWGALDEVLRPFIKEEKRIMRAVPLTMNPILKHATLTQSGPATLLLAVVHRYAVIEKAGPEVRAYATEAWNILYRNIQDWPCIVPKTMEEFYEHARVMGWSASKVALYKKAFDDHLENRYNKPTAPVAGKNKEILRIRGDLDLHDNGSSSSVKGRVIYPFTPRDHVRGNAILWSLAMKEWLVGHIHDTRYKCGPYVIKFCVPKKGTASEIEQRLSELEPFDVLELFSGDDGYTAFRNKKMRTVANDLKSCDTTIQTEIQDVFKVFADVFGVPHDVLVEFSRMNECPKKAKFFAKGVPVVKIILKLFVTINCSGGFFTTMLTLFAKMLAQALTYMRWNGDLNLFREVQTKAHTDLGLKIEYEDHPSTRNGTTPIGSDSFLGHIPFKTQEGEIRVLLKSVTKNLILKGSNPQAKGADYAFQCAARALNPELDIRPLHRAMARAMKRYAIACGVDLESARAAYIKADPGREFRLAPDNTKRITEADELKLLENFGVTQEEYYHDMNLWDSTNHFPSQETFLVVEKMARAHYGYG